MTNAVEMEVNREEWEVSWPPLDPRSMVRYFTLNFFTDTGRFPPVQEMHARLHDCEWFDDRMCPGIIKIGEWMIETSQEIA